MTDQISPKLCINCKHIGRNGSGDAVRYRCFAPQNVIKKKIDLVTGQDTTEFNHEYCYSARLTDCGPEGKWFEQAPPPKYVEVIQTPIDSAKRNKPVAADLLSQLDKF